MRTLESVPDLEEALSRPSERDEAFLRTLDGDIAILGAGGKMGPSLARLCRRAADEAGKPSFSEAEIKTILSHGPWPIPAVPDPSNRVSRKFDAIELGMVLFFDQRLSGSGKKACASCHVPERNWTDNLPRGAVFQCNLPAKPSA